MAIRTQRPIPITKQMPQSGPLFSWKKWRDIVMRSIECHNISLRIASFSKDTHNKTYSVAWYNSMCSFVILTTSRISSKLIHRWILKPSKNSSIMTSNTKNTTIKPTRKISKFRLTLKSLKAPSIHFWEPLPIKLCVSSKSI